MTKRTSLKLTDERQRKLDRASEIVADGTHDDPPMSVVIDAALTHLLQSRENLDDVRGTYPPETVKDCCNTDVIGLRYRTSIESRFR